MIKWIVTLPLTPQFKPLLGFFLAPFVTDIIGRTTKFKSLIFVNRTGRKKNNEAFKRFCRSLDGLDIKTSIFADNNELHLQQIPKLIEFLIKRGFITRSREEILLCPCGACEIPNVAFKEHQNSGQKHKTYYIKNRVPYCKLCGHRLQLEAVQVLQVSFPQNIIEPVPIIFPSKFRSEFLQKCEETLNKTRIISRLRNSSPVIFFSNSKARLDVDFLWSLLPVSLRTMDICINSIVVGHRSLAQAALLTVTSRLLGIEIENIIILPYLNIIPSDYNPVFEDSIDELLRKTSTKSIRTALVQGCKKLKNVKLKSSIFYWAEHSLGYLPDSTGNCDSNYQEILEILFSNKVRYFLSGQRKNQKRVSDKEALLISKILQPE